MNKEMIINIFRFIALVLLQALVLNNINFGGTINPYVYIIFILLLPFETPGWLLLLSSFLLGLFVDMFSDTLGMHTAASVFIAYIRNGTIHLISNRDSIETGSKPTLASMGIPWVIKYVVIMVLIHHLLLFYLEVFTLSGFFSTLKRVIVSSFFSTTIIIIYFYLFGGKKEK